MGSKKEWYMDYATHAFITYAWLKCPSREKYICDLKESFFKRKNHLCADESLLESLFLSEVQKHEPLLKDIDAVNQVFEELRINQKSYIIDAVKAVYFIDPVWRPRNGAISKRVIKFATDYPVGERSVYRWLNYARKLFAKKRGISYDLKNGSSGA
jgi:hypothetical protein